MNAYLIAIGSNMGDRLDLIQKAAHLVEARCGKIAARSPLYATLPVGAADQPFLNAAFLLESNLNPESLLKHLLDIEVGLGRTREVHWGNRTIDLDIILVRDAAGISIQVHSKDLSIPHPRMLDRNFVLVPATDIAPDWMHPVSQKTLSNELRSRFPDSLQPLTNLKF